jgi:SAM-dependent methyltransferase
MIKQILIKRAKIARGVLNTYLWPKGQNYNDTEWWDNSFYTDGISDRQTISPKKNPISAKYHYCSVELQIIRHLYNNNIKIEESAVLDIGSGSGHWIDFYKSLGSFRTVGLDVSLSSVNYLKDQYSNQPDITILHGKASDQLSQLDAGFSIVNAIGVMFHIVSDSEWIDTINKISGVLQKDGLFIVGGHFGYLNGLNCQIDRNGQINKRLRSKKYWKKSLINAGFSNVQVYSNNAYLWIKDTLPENNVLVATK